MERTRVDDVRSVPHDISAEEAVIGSLLLDDACFADVRYLTPGDFFSDTMATVFDVCKTLALRHTAVDAITVAQELDRRGKLEATGGAANLSRLIAATPTSLDAAYYAGIVHKLAVARALIIAGKEIGRIGSEPDLDIEDSIKKADNLLQGVRQSAVTGKLELVTPEMMADSMMGLLEHPQTSLRYGFHDIDEMTTGIYPQDYVVIGARPSVGKTELMLEMSDIMATKQQKYVLFASTEMGRNPVLERHFSRNTHISVRELRKMQLNEEEERAFMAAVGDLSETHIYYLFGRRSSDSIWDNARMMKETIGLDCIFVDYLQLLSDCFRGGRDNHATMVGMVSHNLKGISTELNVPVVVASQLSRDVERRDNKRPMLSDLRESGDIEQDADVVLLLHREELYSTAMPDDKGRLEVMMAKHRQLGMGTKPAVLQWIPDQYRYGDAYEGT